VVDEFLDLASKEPHGNGQRRAKIHHRLATLVDAGHDYLSLLAHEHRSDGHPDGDNPPFVQFLWRDDLRLQIETQGDHYRDEPYSHTQLRMLHNLGYQPPFELGDDFSNWTTIREAEGCQPASVAHLLLETLWLLHGVHFETRATCLRAGVSYWTVHFRVAPTKRDIKTEILRRYRSN